MTPPLDTNAACTGCFLYERRGGRTCPTLSDLEVMETLRQVAALYELVLTEGSDAPSPIELMRREAERLRRQLTTAEPPTLPTAPTQSIPIIERRTSCSQPT
jgi:hypothetical protein